MHENKPSKNPFKINSKAWKFCEISKINYENGYSEIVNLETLESNGLKTINGGDWCRNDGSLGKIFNIERKKERGRIVSVQLQGFKKNHFSNAINKKINQETTSQPCAVLAVGSNVECDHKDGRKDNYQMPNNQSMNDFQPLHKSANSAKRQHCKNCKETSARFDATQLGYTVSHWIGPMGYNGSCIGCYWHDPNKFNKEISKNFDKNR